MKMKFERGSKVEVLIKKKVPSGLWRSAEVVADSGNHCTVKYNLHRISPTQHVKKVSREAIRPSPPADCEINWTVGDVVEVFDDGYWRVATILDVMEGDFYFIRVINSFDEFEVPKARIRVRKNWQDNRWVVTGKDYGNCKDKLFATLTRENEQKGNDRPASQNTIGIQKSCLSDPKLKRMVPVSPDAEGCGNVQKWRAVEKREICDRMLPGDSSSCIRKVEIVAFPEEKQVQHFGKTFCSKTTTYRFSKENDSDSDASSVGSCSVNTVPDEDDRLLNSSLSGHRQNDDALSSDAESLEHFGAGEGLATLSSGHWNRNVSGIHMLELNSYRSTLESLRKSGPLSWEQEAYLTDLRFNLHISDDEHLNEVRRLLSLM